MPFRFFSSLFPHTKLYILLRNPTNLEIGIPLVSSFNFPRTFLCLFLYHFVMGDPVDSQINQRGIHVLSCHHIYCLFHNKTEDCQYLSSVVELVELSLHIFVLNNCNKNHT